MKQTPSPREVRHNDTLALQLLAGLCSVVLVCGLFAWLQQGSPELQQGLTEASHVASEVQEAVTGDRRPILHALFIGNSYTTSNDLPGVIDALVNGWSRSARLEISAETLGGARLLDHWERGFAAQKIRARKWDYVVLQEQSQVSLPQYHRDTLFVPAAKNFVGLVRQLGATPLFFMTWQRPDTPAKASDWIDSFASIAQETRAPVAPVGLAYECVKTAFPEWKPYADPGGHPTASATYLAALVFFGALTGEDPRVLPNRVMTKGGVIFDTPETEARALRQCASQAVSEFNAKGPVRK